MSPTEESLQELGVLSKKLNAETDSLNSVIEHLNQRLGEMNLGLTFWLDDDPVNWIPVVNHPGTRIAWEIGYAKLKDEWCIAARKTSGSWDNANEVWISTPSGEPLPLPKAPRIVRVEAAPLLAKLIEALKTQLNRYITDIENAKRLAGI